MRAPDGTAWAWICAATATLWAAVRTPFRRIFARTAAAGFAASLDELLTSEAAQEALAHVLASAMASPAVKEAVLSIVHEITDPLIASQDRLAKETGAWRDTASRFGTSIDDHERRITAIEASR